MKRVLAALSAAQLLVAAQMGSWATEKNRYYGHWSRDDAIAMVLLVPVLAAVGVALREALRTRGWKRTTRLVDHAFLVGLAIGLASLVREVESLSWVGWPLLAIAPLSFLAPKLRIVSRAASVSLIFLPLIPMLAVQVLAYPTVWADPPESEPVFATKDSDASPVFIFVFDAWTQRALLDSRRIHADFPNLAALVARSDFYTSAHSLIASTPTALPSIIYQRKLTIEPADGITILGGDEVSGPSTGVPSMFALAKDYGYSTALVGFHLPYRQILGDQVDNYWLWTDQPRGRTLAGRLGVQLARNYRYLEDPLGSRLGARIYREIDSRYWHRMNREMRQRALDLIASVPRNSFVLFHWPLPHPPFVLEADGSYAGAYSGERMGGTLEQYHRQLRALDHLIGELVSALERSGNFDPALLILTSDHIWVQDPTKGLKLTHVPLIVKHPRQREPGLSRGTIENYRLRSIIQAALRGESRGPGAIVEMQRNAREAGGNVR